jgi:hypothetical protein
MRRTGLGPVDVELALREQPGPIDLDERVQIPKRGDHQLAFAVLGVEVVSRNGILISDVTVNQPELLRTIRRLRRGPPAAGLETRRTDGVILASVERLEARPVQVRSPPPMVTA